MEIKNLRKASKSKRRLLSTLLLFMLAGCFSLAQGQNSPPIAEAGLAEMVVMSSTISLDGTESTAGDHAIDTYEWRNADNEIVGESALVEVGSLALGKHLFTLTITDTEGFSHADNIAVFIGDPVNGNNNRIAIRGGTELVFANGINEPWDDFARDVTDFDVAHWTFILDDLQSAGANAMRIWLHTNGAHSPQFDSQGMVSGLRPSEIANMRTLLDLAYERGIMVSMCLFSFDLLQNQGQDMEVMRNFVEDKAVTQSYIDNALIPMLGQIGNHPGVMTWEILNEGEGMTSEFGWSEIRTEMKYVQQFTNLLAGAIHEYAPNSLVSTSSWNFKAGTDNTTEGANYFNYYRDDRLIAAGGDPKGTLDFYQVHFYPQHFGNQESPFHRPASWWGVDKPIVIGEYPVKEIVGKVNPSITATEAYKLAIEYGYAGVMPWTYGGYDGGNIDDVRGGMAYIRENYTDAVELRTDLVLNKSPRAVMPIPSANTIVGERLAFEPHVDLNDIFLDQEDGTDLGYAVYGNTDKNLSSAQINEQGALNIYLVEGASGKATITISATDSEGAIGFSSFTLNVGEDNGNLAQFKPVTASSFEGAGHEPEFVADADLNTRWSSEYEDEEWIYIDLAEKIQFDQVKLHWEVAYGKAYEIEVSDDAENWTTVFEETNGNGEEDIINFEATEGRYVRMKGITRGTQWGYSLWEFEVRANVPTGFGFHESHPKEKYLEVYPNPVKGTFQFRHSLTKTTKLQVFTVMGALVFSKPLDENENTIDASSWAPGTYLILLTTPDRTYSETIIVR